jgi:hypothetical protein
MLRLAVKLHGKIISRLSGRRILALAVTGQRKERQNSRRCGDGAPYRDFLDDCHAVLY